MFPLFLSAVFLPQTIESPDSKAFEPIYRHFQATLDYTPEVLEQVLHKEYIEISPLGDIDNREKTIGYYLPELKSKSKNPDSFKISEASVRKASPESLVAIYRVTYLIKSGEKTVELPIRVTTVLVKIGEEYKIFSNHFTGIRPKTKPLNGN